MFLVLDGFALTKPPLILLIPLICPLKLFQPSTRSIVFFFELGFCLIYLSGFFLIAP